MRRFKYGNKPTVVDGIKFPSKKEARRYTALRLLERAGEIANLELQVPYDIEIKGAKVCRYIADFVYEKCGAVVVEDCKGVRTTTYRLKAKLMKACHNIEILET